MLKYLIDANLPYYFSLWASEEYVHVKNIDDQQTDTQIWEYAKEHRLTIVTKDTDFSNRMILSEPPPRVIHIKLGNLKMRTFHTTLSNVWGEVCELSTQYKLVRVFEQRLDGIG